MQTFLLTKASSQGFGKCRNHFSGFVGPRSREGKRVKSRMKVEIFFQIIEFKLVVVLLLPLLVYLREQ